MGDLVPKWVVDEILAIPDCSVCGEPVLSKRPTHTVCALIYGMETYSLPQTFIAGIPVDGA